MCLSNDADTATNSYSHLRQLYEFKWSAESQLQ